MLMSVPVVNSVRTTCPEVFDMEDDIAVVKGDSVPGAAEETCRQAAEECPVECIAIED